MQISEIKKDNISAINDLIRASKSYWDHDKDYLEEAMKLVAIDEDWVDEKQGYALIENKEELVGFLGYECHDDFWYLEHLWIKPEEIGSSFGKQAVEFLKHKAKDAGIREISLLPEPAAEGFYEKMGATYTGLEVPSRVKGGPVFKEMKFYV